MRFDFIEYPKLLSQPDANPQELIKEALEQFLSRNDVIGDKVAISVQANPDWHVTSSHRQLTRKKSPTL